MGHWEFFYYFFFYVFKFKFLLHFLDFRYRFFWEGRGLYVCMWVCAGKGDFSLHARARAHTQRRGGVVNMHCRKCPFLCTFYSASHAAITWACLAFEVSKLLPFFSSYIYILYNTSSFYFCCLCFKSFSLWLGREPTKVQGQISHKPHLPAELPFSSLVNNSQAFCLVARGLRLVNNATESFFLFFFF